MAVSPDVASDLRQAGLRLAVRQKGGCLAEGGFYIQQ